MTRCRLQQSFAPCIPLCQSLAPAAVRFHERYHLGNDRPLLCRLHEPTTFSPVVWRLLVGEMIIFGAADIPELLQAPELLCHLTSESPCSFDPLRRAEFAPIQQAHLGTRDLCFGSIPFRPSYVGWNAQEDVDRLADYLAKLQSTAWSPSMLAHRGIDEGQLADELDYTLMCLSELRDIYRRAATAQHVIVAELIE